MKRLPTEAMHQNLRPEYSRESKVFNCLDQESREEVAIRPYPPCLSR